MEQLNQHCELNDILSIYQSEYESVHSHDTALLKIVNALLWAVENREVSALVMIDLSVKFNTADYSVLLAVLKNKFSIDGTTFK